MRSLLDSLATKAAEAAKAVVGVATPIVTTFVTEALADVSAFVVGLIAAGATGVAVWGTPNKKAG